MTGTIMTRTLADGSKRYDAVWRADGKQKWRTFTRRKAAEKFLAGAVKATHEGTYQDVTPTLMGAVFDRWLTHSLDVRVKQRLLKPSTATTYRSMVATHLRPAFGDVRSDQLRARLLDDWAATRANDLEAGTMSPKSYNNLVNLLHVILAWAKHPAQGYLAHDPMVGLRRLPRSKIERPYLEPAQIPILLTAAADVRDSTILAVAVYTGLRRGELFGLQWPDVDWSASQITVRRSLYHGAETTPKTAHSARTLDIPPSLLACLSLYRACFPVLGDGYVFRLADGAHLDPDNWSKRQLAPIMTRAVAAGVRRIGLHGLRHTYASLLINQGESLKYVSRQLGHATIDITANLYGHLFRETGTAAMGRLDARIESAAAGGKVIRMPDRTGTHG